jgi:glycosyltransferase involved in cell wall biosynthesis
VKTICFDLRALQIGHENRGIGMYIKSVLEHMPADSNRYLFYVFDRNDPIKNLGINIKFDYKIVQTPTFKTALNSPKDVSNFIKLINHSFDELKTLSPDIFVQFDFILGLPKWKSTKTVVIGYDLIPLIKKNEYLPSVVFAWQNTPGKKAKLKSVPRSMYHQLRYQMHYKVFKRADHIISISKATAESFTKLLGIPSQKIHAIPLAPVFTSTEPDNSVLKKIKQPYILYVGGTDSRKRLRDIVQSFNIVRGRGAKLNLVLAGNEFKKIEHLPDVEGRNAIINSPYKQDIVLVGFIGDAEKMALYKSAYAFVFCSTYEGFGLPIIEAMSLGCPVVSYNNSSIPEAAGDAALLVETGDYVAVANRIISLEGKAQREKLIKKGLEQAKKFSWDNYAYEFSDLLMKL